MSIFDHVRHLKSDPELMLLIKLKYGEPRPDDEYFASLPESVIHAAYKKMSSHPGNSHEPDFKALSLSIMLRQIANRKATIKAIHEALIEYHTLLL